MIMGSGHQLYDVTDIPEINDVQFLQLLQVSFNAYEFNYMQRQQLFVYPAKIRDAGHWSGDILWHDLVYMVKIKLQMSWLKWNIGNDFEE